MLFPKSKPVRSEAYRRAVASLPCWLCCVCCYSQAAHGDQGKGLGIKACDLTCWPACGPHDDEPGCHWLVGTSGRYSRDERRELEQKAAADTRALLVKMAEFDRDLRKVLVKVGLIQMEAA